MLEAVGMPDWDHGWRDLLLRLLARGAVMYRGRPLPMRVVSAVVERILTDDDLAARLDELDEDDFRAEFLRLCREELEGPSRD